MIQCSSNIPKIWMPLESQRQHPAVRGKHEEQLSARAIQSKGIRMAHICIHET